MNSDFEDVRRAVQHLLTDVEPNDPETISHAIAHYAASIPPDKHHRMGAPEPRIKEGKSVGIIERTDGWRAR